MINYMVDSENVGTKWIPYLKENITGGYKNELKKLEEAGILKFVFTFPKQ